MALIKFQVQICLVELYQKLVITLIFYLMNALKKLLK